MGTDLLNDQVNVARADVELNIFFHLYSDVVYEGYQLGVDSFGGEELFGLPYAS